MTSRTQLVGVTSEVLDHRRARHQPRDAWENKWAGAKASGAQEGVIPMERLSWWRGEERSASAQRSACEQP